MAWNLSDFGKQLSDRSGIGELMDDLGHALAKKKDDLCMLGGGQPAHIPEIETIWRRRLQEIATEPGATGRVLGEYEPPAGNTEFRKSVAQLFQREFGWHIGPENVGVTLGGQSAFFFLFNALAGPCGKTCNKKILFPIAPEYIGYANQALGGTSFRSMKPIIDMTGSHEFKYRVDFESLKITDDVAAICVSRPTNPTGNVLTDEEISRLASLARKNHIPLIIDNAYGAPFPNAVFTHATPIWNEDIILTLSLSKIGLPGTRTGIVIAREDLIHALSSMTSHVGLANVNIGQAIVAPLIDTGEILDLSATVIQPYYLRKSQQAQALARTCFDDSLPYRIHRSEGAFFLWLWFDGLPISSQELYQRLKQRNVFVVPGNHFFFGLDDSQWRHRDECLRVTFTMRKESLQRGYQIIAEEVHAAYNGR